MIPVKEVSATAAKAGVNDLQIEKDYVLSWILFGISENTFLKENLIFKGGTLLKKAYFPNYRFAEELEFTCKEVFDTIKIKVAFSELIKNVQQRTGMILTLRGDVKDDTSSFNLGISYAGLLGGVASAKVIRVNISKNELVYNAPEIKELALPYSDLINEKFSLLCYTIDEILPEKMRLLIERCEAADVYDVWYLLEMDGYAIEDCIFAFQEKARFKKIDPSILKTTVEKKVQDFAKHWRDDLARQMKIVPDYHDVWRQLEKFWRKYQRFID